MKKVVAILAIIGFLVTVPALYQNGRRVSQVKKELKEVLSMARVICDSDCHDYPSDWIIPEQEVEAELYCMRQCSNNKKAIKDALLEDFPVLYNTQYNYRVGQLYCLLGLACPPSEIIEYVRGF